MKFEEIKNYYATARNLSGIGKARAMLNVQQLLLSNRSKYGKKHALSMDAHCALALLKPHMVSCEDKSEFGRLHQGSFKYLGEL
jgi:hypothetical protein